MALRIRGIFYTLLIAVMTLTGCGADDSEQPATSTPPPQSADATTTEDLALPKPIESGSEVELRHKLVETDDGAVRYLQFSLVATMPNGRTETVRQDVEWTSSDAAVVEVDSAGQGTIGRPGQTEVSATFLGQSMTMTVVIPKADMTLSAE